VNLTTTNALLGDVALFCAKELGVDQYNVRVIINECCLKHDNAWGWCYDIHDNEVDIEIEQSLSDKDKIITLCHEMVHAWQFSQGRESCEDEANKLEETLYNGFLHKT